MAGTSEKWAAYAGRHMKAELKRTGIGYAELAKRLTEMEIPETDTSVSAKINRGVFPAWFLFATMKAIGRDVVRLDDV